MFIILEDSKDELINRVRKAERKVLKDKRFGKKNLAFAREVVNFKDYTSLTVQELEWYLETLQDLA